MADLLIGSFRLYILFRQRLHLLPFLRLQTAVGHQHPHGLLVFFQTIEKRITFRLCQMDRNRLFQKLQLPKCTFDLLYHKSVRLLQDPIRPAFHLEDKVFIFFFKCQRYLRLIKRSHFLLDPLMGSCPRLHGVLVRDAAPAVVQVSAAEQKFHQISHGYPDPLFLLFQSSLLYSKREAAALHATASLKAFLCRLLSCSGVLCRLQSFYATANFCKVRLNSLFSP